MTTTLELIEEEKRAKSNPFAALDAEAQELYVLLIEIQKLDPEYNDILQVFGDRKQASQVLLF